MFSDIYEGFNRLRLPRNVFEVINHFRRNKKVDFAVIHPQLCATDGDNFWRALLSGNWNVEMVIVAGCDPVMQRKMFRWFSENWVSMNLSLEVLK